MCSSAWMWKISFPPGGIAICLSRWARCWYSGGQGGLPVCSPGPEIESPAGVLVVDPQPAAASASSASTAAEPRHLGSVRCKIRRSIVRVSVVVDRRVVNRPACDRVASSREQLLIDEEDVQTGDNDGAATPEDRRLPAAV